MDARLAYEIKRDRLTEELATARTSGRSVALQKSTSNLFRDRQRSVSRKIDVRSFRSVLEVDAVRGLADVEGMAEYGTIVRETLRYGLLPAVTPQLKTITAGGAVAGLGIESSSFRFGLAHETVEETEVLLANGTVVTCSRDMNSDLFYGFPNSYGTLGYILRLKLKLVPAKPFVRLTHTHYADAGSYFAAVAAACERSDADFVDGVVFGAKDLYLTAGQFTNTAPYASDYTYMGIYYRSIRTKTRDFLSAADYIWRWDTDWFWCSRQFHAQNPAVRFLATRRLLNSRTYHRLMRLSRRLLPPRRSAETVIQDVDIPIENAGEFLEFFLATAGITPIWICPFRCPDADACWPLYPLDPQKLYINFGFWDVVPSRREPGYYNRLIEKRTVELGGRKSLYSDVYYDKDAFRSLYNGSQYDALKQRYDPEGLFPGLYEKCVQRR